MWTYSLIALIGFTIGFGVGKLDAILRMDRWLKSLSEWDQVTVRSLLKTGTRSEENAEFDARINSHH